MKTYKRLTAFLLIFAIVLTLVPGTKALASSTDINIVSETEVTAKDAKKWAESKGATETFIDLADLYFEYASEHGAVNPAIAYVQAAKETGYGKFGGVLDESYNNPCGMKTSVGGADSDPNAHQRFNSWDEGVKAHLDHLALYAGAKGYPRSDTYDPRHFVTIKGKATTVNALGGNWAPSPTYGEEINKLYNDLLKSAGIEIEPEVKPDDSEDSDNKEDGDKDQGSESNPSEDDKPSTPQGPSAPEASKPIEKPTDNSTNISSSIGWKYEGGNWYYYRSNGSKATGWIKPDNNWYYLYSNGMMATGWLNSGGTWYYLNSNGAMHIGWLKDGAKWYYLQGDGSMVTGLKLINGKKYFLDVSGAMRIGWFQIGGYWYYFDSDGGMINGWIRPDGNWYYLYSNGIMATGWVKLGSEWYHLKSNGAMSTGWLADGNDFYYLNPSSGAMMKDTVVDGWKLGSDGKRGEKVNGGGSKKLVVIDPGHNFGGDDGAYATHNRVTYVERDLNMQLGVKLKAKLEAKGYQVIMTRNELDRETLGVTQSLTNRVNMANNFGADFFVSLHHNSAGSSSATGVETYYTAKGQDSNFGGAYSDYKISVSKTMAGSINNSIVNRTGAVNRGAKDGNLFVCRNTKMPSVLIEFGFITNPQEAVKCADPSYQDLSTAAVADAIASGI